MTFAEFLAEHPDFPDLVRSLAKEHTNSSTDPLHCELVYDLTMRDVQRQWPTIRDPIAFVHHVLPLHASKLRKKKRVVPTTSADPEVQQETVADSREASALELLVAPEEWDHVVNAVARLSDEERDVLDALANTKSGREAAEKLGIPEATYRLKRKRILKKIQPPPGLRDHD